MARERGTFSVPSNYEPLKAAPFDARSLVQTKADLTAAPTWQQDNGDIWIYSGMLVAVCADTEENNGLYVLSNAVLYQQESSWIKLANISQINELKERIDNIPTLENIKIIYGGNSNVATI